MDKKVFITKICTAGTYSYKRVDEEYLFPTEEIALDYLKDKFFEQNPNKNH